MKWIHYELDGNKMPSSLKTFHESKRERATRHPAYWWKLSKPYQPVEGHQYCQLHSHNVYTISTVQKQPFFTLPLVVSSFGKLVHFEIPPSELKFWFYKLCKQQNFNNRRLLENFYSSYCKLFLYIIQSLICKNTQLFRK